MTPGIVPEPSEPQGGSWATKLDSFLAGPTDGAAGARATPASHVRSSPVAVIAVPAPPPASTINETLQGLMTVEGAKCVALVDSASGMILGQAGSGVNMDIAAAGNTEVLRATTATAKALDRADNIDDLLITLTTEYHIIRPVLANSALFLYLVLDRSKSNLAMARYKVIDADMHLVI